MELLTSYRDFMIAKFKENVKEANDFRLGLQEILEDGLAHGDEKICYRIPTFYEDGIEQFDTTNDHIVNDLAGYILHARQRMIQCKDCWKTLATSKENLPGDFLENAYTDFKDRGCLKWATPNFYYTISAVEKILDDQFKKTESYVKDSFEDVITKLSSLTLPTVCCEKHRKGLIPKLVFEYVVIRFMFKARQGKNVVLTQVSTQRHTNMKMSKLISTKVDVPVLSKKAINIPLQSSIQPKQKNKM